MRLSGLYVILDTTIAKSKDLLEVASQIIDGGADIIQFRDKKLSMREIVQKALPVRKLTEKAKVLFTVNDRPDIALELDADGVHLGQNDICLNSARKILGKEKLIGISTHNLEQAKKAEAEGADYISVGPIFATPLKKDTKPVGLNLIEKVRNTIKIPFVAIGGINLGNIDQVLNAGAKTVAVIRAVLQAEDITRVTRELRKRLTS